MLCRWPPCSSVHKTRQLLKHYKNIEMCSTHLTVFTTVPNECIETCISVQDTNCRLEVSRLCDFDLHNFFFFFCFDTESFSDCHIFVSRRCTEQTTHDVLWISITVQPLAIFNLYSCCHLCVSERSKRCQEDANKSCEPLVRALAMMKERLHPINDPNLNCYPNWEICKKNKWSGSYLPTFSSLFFVYTWYDQVFTSYGQLLRYREAKLRLDFAVDFEGFFLFFLLDCRVLMPPIN